jgi:hypothetical protein
LTGFRAAAIRSLHRLGHEVVAMEEFTAATSFPLDRVLKLVCDLDIKLSDLRCLTRKATKVVEEGEMLFAPCRGEAL